MSFWLNALLQIIAVLVFLCIFDWFLSFIQKYLTFGNPVAAKAIAVIAPILVIVFGHFVIAGIFLGLMTIGIWQVEKKPTDGGV